MTFLRHFFFIISLFLATTASQANELSLDLMPSKATALAEVTVNVVAQMNGKKLDYSPESLKIIDQLVLGFRKEGNSVESMNKTLIIFGCYVGEVMVRNLGYKWDNPTQKEISIGFDLTGVRGKNAGFSNPIGKVFKLMKNGQEDSVEHFYNVFSKDLTELAPEQAVKN
ncbi:MAG: hypothetical protein NT086_06345 [Proteobacteria bacterium]|jgi:hypothetical protein|nr:hypothetical protein [Pseudomonadota bacterium]